MLIPVNNEFGTLCMLHISDIWITLYESRSVRQVRLSAPRKKNDDELFFSFPVIQFWLQIS